MNDLEKLLDEVTPNHKADVVFLLVGVVSLGVAITMSISFLYLIAVFGLFFGSLMVYGTYKRRKDFHFIRDNQYKDYKACIQKIDHVIQRMEAAIAVDQRKADAGGKDAADSRDDVIRKTAILQKYQQIKEILTPDILT